MSFPISPTDGQTTTVNGIPYTYSLAKNSWTRTPQPVGNLTVTGNLVANVLYTDYGIRWAGNGAPYGGGLTIKSDLVTYTTSGTFYGNADIGFTVSAIGGVGIDDIQYAITLPVGKTITFLGNTYNDQEVHLVSNGYVYFAPVSTGITEYYLPGPGQVNVPAVFIGASDWSIQKYYYGIANGTDTFVIGYEGTINTTGNITASPSMKWELQFDLSGPDNNNQLSIVLDNSISNSNFYSLMATYAGGVWGISDGNQWLDRINPMPWWGWNDTSNDYAYHYKANINTMPADITAGKLAFVGPGVNVVTDGDTDFINIDPFDGLLSLNFDDNNAIAVLSSQHYGLRITNAQADNPIEIKPSLRGYVEIAGGDTSANQDGQAGNVYIRGGTATGVGDKHGAVYVLTGTGVNPWIFGENGLTFPDGNVQTTAYTGGGGGGSYANADVKIYLESLSNVNIGVGSGSINQGADSVAIGPYAGNTSQKDFSIAIGSNGGFTGNYYAAQDYAAGGYNQNLWATAIGAQAGAYEQGAGAIAIGTGAGARTQGVNGIAIGEESGAYWQGKESIAIGIFAGSDHQGENSTAMGYAAGKEYQGTLATALGTYAGYVNQSNLSVAIGSYAGFEQQGNLAIAIGPYAGNNTQSDFSIAIGSSALQGNTFGGEGYSAGGYNQGYNSVAIGPQSGAYNQGNYAVAIGDTAGVRDQQNTAIAIGLLAGQINQNYAAIAIGESAGASDQGADSVAIGFIAGRLYQGTLAIAIGSSAGRDGQGINSIALGREAGDTTQGNLAIAIGPYAGNISQGAHAVAIGGNGFYGNSYASEGYAAGGYNQGAWATAVGVNAGAYNQGTDATALGDSAGARNQGNEATAVGFTSGLVNQGQGAVAVGVGSGEQTQGTYSVAVGALAGANYQQELAIAIGKFAGRETQGYRSIAIGASAGYNNQAGNSIIITANGQVDSTTSGFFVDPVRNVTSGNLLVYNTTDKEVLRSNVNIVGQSGTPSNTTTPASWLQMQVAGVTYYMPLYQ